MPQLKKTLAIRDIDEVQTFAELKAHLREVFETLKTNHKAMYNDIKTKEAVHVTVGGVNWRFKVVGNNLEVQRKESGTWNTKFTFEPS